MNSVCIICFDTMDMEEFEDGRESTSSCVKLDCGHAYHTKCIIRCLSNMNKSCPNCNKEKTPAQEMTYQGILKEFVTESRRDPIIKQHLAEYKESRAELRDTKRQMHKEIIAFIETRKKELLYEEKRSYFIKCISLVQSSVKGFAKAKGPMYIGAIAPREERRYRSYWNGSLFERMYFGKMEAFYNGRLKGSRIYVRGL